MEKVNYKQKMKNSMFLILVALIVSCSNHQLSESVSEVMSEAVVDEKAKANAEFNALMDKARWGDGQAFLKLADCYRDGIGVKPDFLGMMCMAFIKRLMNTPCCQDVEHDGCLTFTKIMVM